MRIIFSAFGIVAAVIATWLFRPAAPQSIEIARDAAILYYNNPAAVQVDGKIYVGYIKMDGAVEVADVDFKTGHIDQRRVVHQYAGPDDHAAPALWPTENGLLVATAFHSSDLFLYRVLSNRIERLCHWPGMFTYPRFAEVNGETWLYVRNDPNRAGSLAVIKSPEKCNPEQVIYRAKKETWLYATVPDGNNIAWSVWDTRTNKHTGAFLNGQPFRLTQTSYDEELMWSIAGSYRSATRFEGSFACCGVGAMIAELYQGDAKVYSTPVIPSPYYPTGIVLATDADEAFIPAQNGRFERRSLPLMMKLPSCPQDGTFNSRQQYVAGSGGSYLWLSFDTIAGSLFGGARIRLCIAS